MERKTEKNQFKSTNLLCLMSLTFIIVLNTPLIINAQTGKANFAGDWTYNTEKSTQPQVGQGGQGGGGAMRMGGGNFVATQEANLLTVVRTRTGQDGQSITSTVKYLLDGKESVNTSPRGESKSVASWSADGKSLTIETSRVLDMNGESRTIKSTEIWTLSDAKTLTIESNRQGPNGSVKTTSVYNRK